MTTGGGYDRSWHRVGRTGAYFAGVAFLAIIVLSLLDSLGALGSVPGYHSTAAGLVADEATYWKGFYAHQHDILWNIFLRDSLQPLAFIAVVLVSLAVLNVVGPRRAAAQIAVAAFALAAVVGCLDGLAWLTMGQYWRSDWSGANATVMVAVGRDTYAITNLTHQYTQLGNLALAAGLVLLGFLTRPQRLLPFRLRYLAWTGAALLVLSLIVDQTQLDTASNVLTLLSALVFPPLLFWIGRSFTRNPTVPQRVAS